MTPSYLTHLLVSWEARLSQRPAPFILAPHPPRASHLWGEVLEVSILLSITEERKKLSVPQVTAPACPNSANVPSVPSGHALSIY